MDIRPFNICYCSRDYDIYAIGTAHENRFEDAFVIAVKKEGLNDVKIYILCCYSIEISVFILFVASVFDVKLHQ